MVMGKGYYKPSPFKGGSTPEPSKVRSGRVEYPEEHKPLWTSVLGTLEALEKIPIRKELVSGEVPTAIRGTALEAKWKSVREAYWSFVGYLEVLKEGFEDFPYLE